MRSGNFQTSNGKLDAGLLESGAKTTETQQWDIKIKIKRVLTLGSNNLDSNKKKDVTPKAKRNIPEIFYKKEDII